MNGLTQDEILQSTRTVCQGLEALKEEHETIKSQLMATSESLAVNERSVVEEKVDLLSKSLESVQLGIEEAHVSQYFYFVFRNTENNTVKIDCYFFNLTYYCCYRL